MIRYMRWEESAQPVVNKLEEKESVVMAVEKLYAGTVLLETGWWKMTHYKSFVKNAMSSIYRLWLIRNS